MNQSVKDQVDIDNVGGASMEHEDSRGYTGFFTCTCSNHAYHSNCSDECGCENNPYLVVKE